MSYLFFLLVGVVWGLGCGFCDSRGILRRDRVIMQILTGLIGYGVAWVLFGFGQPAGGLWLIHLIEVVVISGLLHNYSRGFFIGLRRKK